MHSAKWLKIDLVFIKADMNAKKPIAFVSYELFLWSHMYKGGASCCSNFTSPAPVCPGSEVTFTCTVVDPGVPFPGSTIWIVGTNRCGLSHSTAPDPQVSCGRQFTAALEAPQGGCYTSTITATVDYADSGLPVSCYAFEEIPRLLVGNASVDVIGQHVHVHLNILGQLECYNYF